MVTAADAAQPFASLSSYLPTVITSKRHTELCNSVIPSLIDAISGVSRALRKSQQVSLVGSANAFGDDQLNVDVIAEDIIRDALAKSPSVVTASSEEDPVERSVHGTQKGIDGASGSSEQYTVAFDPLDGSSIIAPNWSVGTIIGIWEGATALNQPPAEKQIASILGVFGPRTIAIVAVRIPGSGEGVCFEVSVSEDGGPQDSVILRPSIRFAEPPFKTRYFAPANLRAAAEDEKYMNLVTHFIQNKYTLRYSGGLVPDVVHALVKGHGVYISPVTEHSKAKLRRLFELFPLALIVECAGGLAIDPADGSNILERALEDINERAGLVCGVREDVEFVKGLI